MAVLVYLVVLSMRGSVRESVTPAGPVHTVFMVNPTSTFSFSSTVQVIATLAPGITGSLETVTTGSGTARKLNKGRIPCCRASPDG